MVNFVAGASVKHLATAKQGEAKVKKFTATLYNEVVARTVRRQSDVTQACMIAMNGVLS
jgi:hypothetical protein